MQMQFKKKLLILIFDDKKQKNPTSVTQPLITVYVTAISLSIVFGGVVIVLMAKKVMSINRKYVQASLLSNAYILYLIIR